MPQRPRDLIYAVDERPPWLRLAALGLQHAILASVYLVLIALIVRDAGAPPRTSVDAIGLGMIALAVGTVLQALPKGPVGSGYLAPPVFSAIYFGPSVLAAKAGGLPLVFGMTVFAGLVEIVLSRLVRRLRHVFQPSVSGFVVCIVGIQLGLVGMDHTLDVPHEQLPQFPWHLATAVATLAVCVGLSIWARGVMRLTCSLIGLGVGIAVAFVVGMIPPEKIALLRTASWLSYPHLGFIAYRFAPDLAPTFFAAALAATLRTIGVITTCQRINDAAWKRPELGSIKRGILADGIGCLFGGLIGAPGMNTAPSLVGVSSATGATSRHIAYACGAILAGFAFVPKFAAVFLALPVEVAGAILVFTASFMIAGGIQIIASRSIDTRVTYVIGISLLVALSRLVFPGYFAALPGSLRSIADNSLALGIVFAIGLTLLFRIGARHSATLAWEGTVASQATLDALLRRQCEAWKLAGEITGLCVAGTRQLVGDIAALGPLEKPLSVDASYDGVDLVVELRYEGRLPVTQQPLASLDNLQEEEAVPYGLSRFLAHTYADDMRISTKGERVKIRLRFST